MKVGYLFIILILACVFGCSKKEDDNVFVAKTVTVVGADSSANPDTVLITSVGDIICDDTAGTYWVNYNYLLKASQNWVPAYFSLDVNNDQISDFRLVSEQIGSPGTGYHPHSLIESMNSYSKFLGYLKNDTAFYSNTSISYPQNPPPLVVYVVTETHSCYNFTGTDLVLSVTNNFKISALNAGDTVKANYYYQADSLMIINDNISYSSTNSYLPDSISVHTYNNFVECDQFPMNSIHFIGFKTKVNNVDKYGWIKLKITNQNEIFIYSTAIQK